MAKKQEKFDPTKPKPRPKKTEFDKAWQRIFKEAEKPYKEEEKKPTKN
jgi:hypothetical protein